MKSKNVAERSPYVAMSEEDIYTKLEHSRYSGKEGRYREADAVISDMRAKYGI